MKITSLPSGKACLLVGCLTSQQHASVSHGQVARQPPLVGRHEDCFCWSHTSDLTTGTLVATLPCAWHHRVRVTTDWCCVSMLWLAEIMWLAEIVCLICNCYFSVVVCNCLQIHPKDTLLHVSGLLGLQQKTVMSKKNLTYCLFLSVKKKKKRFPSDVPPDVLVSDDVCLGWFCACWSRDILMLGVSGWWQPLCSGQDAWETAPDMKNAVSLQSTSACLPASLTLPLSSCSCDNLTPHTVLHMTDFFLLFF